MTFDPALIIVAPLLAGLVASVAPCVLPLYPGFLAWVTGSGQVSRAWVVGLLVLAGVVSFMLALGLVIGLLGLPTAAVNLVIVPLSALIILVLGILLVAGVPVFAKLPSLVAPNVKNPYLASYLYGVLYGPVSFPCSAPFAIAVFTLAVGAADVAIGVLAFLMFGLGLGIPLLVLAIVGQGFQVPLTRFFATHHRAIELVSGLLLVGVAVYITWENWESLMLAAGFIS